MDAFSTNKKIVIWILILVGVFIFSDFLISVGLNSTYKDIQREDNNAAIVVYQADATYVNGRMRGLIKETEELQGKYVKVELYSKRDVLAGKSYIEIQNSQKDGVQPFELLFRAQDVAYYKMEVVNEKESGDELEILSKEMTKPEIILATAMMFLIFWG
ncbi:MAG: hypothetical protein HFJ35_08280 [Clostridia bacterium]|nr:hypothetical protein [Clostridia bacterium]